MPLSPAEQMIYNATKITTFAGDAELGTGTGFFYTIQLANDRSVNLLITNKHVLKGADRAGISFHLSDKRIPVALQGRLNEFS